MFLNKSWILIDFIESLVPEDVEITNVYRKFVDIIIV